MEPLIVDSPYSSTVGFSKKHRILRSTPMSVRTLLKTHQPQPSHRDLPHLHQPLHQNEPSSQTQLVPHSQTGSSLFQSLRTTKVSQIQNTGMFSLSRSAQLTNMVTSIYTVVYSVQCFNEVHVLNCTSVYRVCI